MRMIDRNLEAIISRSAFVVKNRTALARRAVKMITNTKLQNDGMYRRV